jgi:hypothetical protein
VVHAPCDSASINSVTISDDQGISNYTTNVTAPFLIAANTSDSILITFPPQSLNVTATVRAEIKGSYTGTSSKFDTTAQTKVTFACADAVPDNAQATQLTISDIHSNNGMLSFEIASSNSSVGEGSVQLLSVLGTVVATKRLERNANQTPVTWAIGDVPSGAYYLRVEEGSDRATARFMLVR